MEIRDDILRIRNALRRFATKNPLAFPLLTLVCSLSGATLLSPVSVALPVVCRLYRVGVCALLAGLYGWGVHCRYEAEPMQVYAGWLSPECVSLRLSGLVVRTMGNSALMKDDATGRLIEVSGGRAFPKMQEEERWCVEGVPREILNEPYPGGFDRKRWLANLGCYCHLDVCVAERMDSGTLFGRFLAGASYFRRSLALMLARGCDVSSAGYQTLVSLMLGEKKLSDPQTIDVFRRSGCIHIFAVSGLHTGVIALLVALFLRMAHCSPRLTVMMTICLLTVYLYITGFPVSAVRAYVMIVLFFCARLLRRQSSSVNVWCAAAFLILTIDPRQLTSAGFQLSFALYAAVICGARWALHGRTWWGPDPYIPYRIFSQREKWRSASDSWARGLAVVSLTAWLCSLPLMAWHFHTINLFGFVVNILIAPLLPCTMGLGLSALFFSWIPGLSLWLNKAACLSASVLFHLAEYSADVPHAYLPTSLPPPSDTVQIFTFPYGGYACLLGNPGLLVDCGSERDAEHRLLPSLFARNTPPVAFLPTRHTVRQIGGRFAVMRQYSQMHLLAVPLHDTAPLRFETAAGRFTVYPPAPPLGRPLADDAAPVILWENASCRMLYVGAASLRTLMLLPPQERCADAVILGAHAWDAASDAEWLQSTNARAVYRLPDAQASPESPLLPCGKTVSIPPESYTRFRLSECACP